MLMAQVSAVAPAGGWMVPVAIMMRMEPVTHIPQQIQLSSCSCPAISKITATVTENIAAKMWLKKTFLGLEKGALGAA